MTWTIEHEDLLEAVNDFDDYFSEWNWFDYVLNVDRLTTGHSIAMRLQELGYSFLEARTLFQEPRTIYNASDLFPYEKQMHKMESLISEGSSLEDAAAWAYIAAIEDLSNTETLEYASRRELDPQELLATLQTHYQQWSYAIIYNAVLNGIDMHLMGEIYGDSINDADSDIISYQVFIRDYYGTLDVDIEGEGVHVGEHYLKFVNTSNDYMGDADGTCFERQVAKERPYDPKASAVRQECIDIIVSKTRLSPERIKMNVRYVIDPGN